MPAVTRKRLAQKRVLLKGEAAEDPVSDLKQILLRYFEKPYVLLLYLAVLLLLLSRVDSDTLDIVETLAAQFPNNPVLKWVMENFYRVCGALVFLPVVVDAKAEHRTLIGFLIGILLLALPQRSIVEYFLYSISLHIYAKAKNFYTRFVIIGVSVGLCMFFGILTQSQLQKLYSELPNVPTHPVNKVAKVNAAAQPSSSLPKKP
ncbi:putative transmembrane protein [Pistachio virus Y]|uniref:p23 n=2 Tax=Kitaviridae TaxID=2560061 RepID=A0A7T0Q775_9VIRU|nr:p23 [Pistachio virus X]QPL17818.1 putative transmembrane protein [Pistachio virus Y]